MKAGFLFWPFSPGLVRAMAAAAERDGYDMIGIASDPPGTVELFGSEVLPVLG